MLRNRSLLLLIFLPALAQQADFSGLVRDRSQAAVPMAVVTIRNETSGSERSAITSIAGLYSFSFLDPGAYTLEIRAQGFQTGRETGIKLAVGQSARLDFTLDLGAVEQSVTVRSETSLIPTDSSTISTTVNRQFLENLPLNGRSFQSLIALTPGVVMTKATFGEQGQFSVNGQRANANYFTIDGVSANIGVSAGLTLVQSGSGSLPGLSATGGTNSLVSVDALEEFQVQTSGYAAEFGRMPGAQISILTRSGGNRFHGSVFDFFRNSALDASDWFANANRLPDSALRQNDFGGVLGGPIRKDHTFFFFSYEGLRLRQPQFAATDVPSRQYRSLAGSSTAPYLNAFPLPTGPDNRSGYAPFVATYSDASELDATSLRIDHAINSRVTLFGRYNYAPSNYISRIYALSNPTTTDAKTQTLTLGATAQKRQVVSCTITVLNPQSVQSNSSAISVGTPAPVFSAAGVLNAASYAPAPVSIGEILVIYGQNFGTVDHTTVLFDNNPAKIIYLTPTQLAATVPVTAGNGQTTIVQIQTSHDVFSATLRLRIASAAPGLFTLDASGKGQAAAINEDYSVNGPDHRAPAGSVIALYATGGGALTRDQLPRVALPITATIGGQNAEVLYAGIAPGQPEGMLQINVRVPAGFAGGSQEVVVQIGDVVSQQGATVAVK